MGDSERCLRCYKRDDGIDGDIGCRYKGRGRSSARRTCSHLWWRGGLKFKVHQKLEVVAD